MRDKRIEDAVTRARQALEQLEDIIEDEEPSESPDAKWDEAIEMIMAMSDDDLHLFDEMGDLAVHLLKPAWPWHVRSVTDGILSDEAIEGFIKTTLDADKFGEDFGNTIGGLIEMAARLDRLIDELHTRWTAKYPDERVDIDGRKAAAERAKQRDPELTCAACERPLSECDGCVRDATDADGNVLT